MSDLRVTANGRTSSTMVPRTQRLSPPRRATMPLCSRTRYTSFLVVEAGEGEVMKEGNT